MQRDPWGRPIRGARISNPWFDPPPPRPVAPSDRFTAPRDPFAQERAAVEAEQARRASAAEAARVAARPVPTAAAPRRAWPSWQEAGDYPIDEPAAPSPPPAPPPAPIAAPRADDRAELRRALDDLEAAKERVARDGKRAEDAARLKLVGELLPVLDDLDRSIASGSTDKTLLHGVELVRQGLERVLAGYGLDRITSVNERFDPAVHEAIAVAPVTEPELDGVVLNEISRGYRLGDKVQRPARVRVGQLVAP